MKCPKCEYEMNKIKEAENIYYYRCPKCRYTIGKKEEEEREDNE